MKKDTKTPRRRSKGKKDGPIIDLRGRVQSENGGQLQIRASVGPEKGRTHCPNRHDQIC